MKNNTIKNVIDAVMVGGSLFWATGLMFILVFFGNLAAGFGPDCTTIYAVGNDWATCMVIYIGTMYLIGGLFMASFLKRN